jgi:hypothetical protein
VRVCYRLSDPVTDERCASAILHALQPDLIVWMVTLDRSPMAAVALSDNRNPPVD